MDEGIELFTRLDHEGLYCQQCVGNQARERCTVDRGIGIMEVVRANVVSDVAVQLEPGEVREVLAAEGSESESESDARSLACAICNSIDALVVYYTLVDGRIMCAPCRDADDTLPAVASLL